MNFGAAIGSSVGRKILNAVTGLFFVGFVIGHLTGNLLLFVGPEAFNDYAHFLTTVFHGVGVIIAEIVMVAFLTVHAATGISVWMNKSRARSHGYQMQGNAGGRSNKSAASKSMLYTGILLLAFIAFHVAQFKFGVIDPRQPEDQWVMVDGVHVRNLYGLVVDSFQQPIWAIGYIVIMAMLGTHLWHGTWSAFQSMGLANDRYLPIFRTAGHVLAVALAVGFLALPAVIFLGNDHFQQLDQKYEATYKITAPATVGHGG